jgi:putative DNA primase/helicase
MEAFMSRDRPEHSTELARMAGARLITATETEEGARLNEARIKVLTGNDRISARFMRQDQFDFTPSAKIILAGNHRPSLKSVGEEMRRRVHLVEFPDTIPEQDRQRNLPDLLKAEYPQILHWMLQGREWLDIGLGKPESVAQSTDKYLENEDTFGAWLIENVERNATARERAGSVYKNYHSWCEANGDFPVSQKRFAQQLESRGFVRVRPGGVRHFQGLKLKYSSTDDERGPPPSYDRD